MIQIYLNVDENGNVKNWLKGRDVIPEEPFEYFFVTNVQEAMFDEDLSIEKCQAWQDETFKK